MMEPELVINILRSDKGTKDCHANCQHISMSIWNTY